jgi:hypothetical protein
MIYKARYTHFTSVSILCMNEIHLRMSNYTVIIKTNFKA